MTKYRQSLPQLDDELFLTDGGIETTLIFHEELDLPYFADFVSGPHRLLICLTADVAPQHGASLAHPNFS